MAAGTSWPACPGDTFNAVDKASNRRGCAGAPCLRPWFHDPATSAAGESFHAERGPEASGSTKRFRHPCR